MTRKELVEGIVGSIAFPLFIYLLHTTHLIPTFLSQEFNYILPWFLAWSLRKISIHLYDEIYEQDIFYKI